MIDRPQDVADRATPTPFGVVVHTTGGGIVRFAAAHGIDPLAAAISIYSAPGANFPHYCIDGTGVAAQIADERELAPHAGIDAKGRALYLSGAWTSRVSKTGLALWRARWPGVKSPLALFPGRSVNQVYLGIELIPTATKTFTLAQYDTLARLLADIERRHGIMLSWSRLVGHEDLEPLERWDAAGGWDPGSLRATQRFSWPAVFSRLRPADSVR
jgi:hypothetical protein